MNSKWQASKIGLLNFWYYDEQEFAFVKGRMLLRGSNGSGKSVTMQSVIPLLLDGNLSPERLDPFGSRDRKMSSYLLEEDDPREERTGYLYLEFKRRESEAYLTIGMGIRARKGKPLDKWYFSLTDGRRIGKDFCLYKETDERVPLTRRELENRIEGGGVVLDRQAEYMEYVNRQIFGFDTADEYKEMIDLLIQLRTPKLSRDFKPSVINDILSDSLQPLSDEDLQPMSEAIENMDTMNLNLKQRKEALQAAEKINRVFGRYNSLILYEKAGQYLESKKRLESLEKEEQRRLREIAACEKRAAQLGQEKVSLDATKEAMEKERDSLNKSDAVGLKARELELSARIEEKKAILAEKEAQLAAKEEQRTEIEGRKREEENREYEKEKELLELLGEMEEDAGDMAFEEHTFFADELRENLGQPYAYDTHQGQMEKTAGGIEEGTELLREADRLQRQADDTLMQRERKQREADGAQRKVTETESLLDQARNEWKEALYRWNGQNAELKLERETLQELSLFGDSYGERSDFASVKQRITDIWIGKKEELGSQLRKKEQEKDEAGRAREEIQRELKEWESHKEPEPERTEAVQKNRERLRNAGIPFQEFYKVIEFDKTMDRAACGRLEEAFLQMGILDALVVDVQYRDQVLTMEEGCADRYLFAGGERAENSVLDVLELNEEMNDIFFNQRITGILGSIAYDGDGTTAVYGDGTYRIGVLAGTVTGTHEAGFLGSRAREENRLAKIAACKAALQEADAVLSRLEEEIRAIRERIRILEEEYKSLPADEDMHVSLRMLQEAQRVQEQLQREADRLAEEQRRIGEELKERKKAAAAVAEKLYLSCDYETFLRAQKAAHSYEKRFYQLKSGHELYRQIAAHIAELVERLEDLDADMDQIRYDAGNTERSQKREEAERNSIREQLKLTDYEEIRERLDQCMQWLNAYPEALRQCVEEETRQSEQARTLREQVENGRELIAQCRLRTKHRELCFQKEWELGYAALPVEIANGSFGAGEPENGQKNGPDTKPENGQKSSPDTKPENGQKGGPDTKPEERRTADAGKVLAYLESDCRTLEKDGVIRDLNRVYFENKGFLTEYQLTQTELFGELDEGLPQGEPGAKRLDLSARYQGTRVAFRRLLDHLKEDIEELSALLRDGDRELFEDILSNTVSRKIRGRINASNAWVEKMNALMGAMNTSSGLKLSLRWRSRTAESEEQLDTRELVELLKKDYRLMREDEAEKLSLHFRSKVEEARRHAADGGSVSFYQVMKETLDYRNWFEFQLFAQKSGERVRELTNSVFGTFSGGEKAMSMYVPLFSAVVAKYQGGRSDAPRLISLDEAFAGVDNKNIRDMFRLMTEFEFDFILNSQVLWGDCDTLDALAIYQLLRPENAHFVTVMPYLWNGKSREMLEDEQEMEKKAEEFNG